MAICISDRGDDRVFGLVLAEVGRDALDDAEYIELVARFVAGLEGHRPVRFVVQTAVSPDPDAAQRGRIAVHVFGVSSEMSVRAMRELGDDLHDLLSVAPEPWTFRPITDEDELLAALEPGEPARLAEIARREAPCPPPGGLHSMGYHQEPGRPDHEPYIWSTWRFRPSGRRSADLVMLGQDEPIVMRTIVQPTDLTVDERDALERLIADVGSELGSRTIRGASARVYERLLLSRPLFEVRTLLASPRPIGASVLSAVGWSVSPPDVEDLGTAGDLEGGFAVVRGARHELTRMRQAFAAMEMGNPLPTLAPIGLERVRRLLGIWETATVLSLPRVNGGEAPGHEVTRAKRVAAPIGDLPLSGVRIGTTAAGSERHPVNVQTEERLRHLYITGQTGTGKSTLLANLALQDIERGSGVAVLDPHGDLVDTILERIPDGRIDDVVVIDPADQEAVVGVNLLEAENPIQKEYVVSELCAMFYQLFDPQRQGIVGPRYESWLRNTALLLLDNPDRESAFIDISTVFADRAVQRFLVDRLTEPLLVEFWKGEMQQTSDYHRSEVLGWFRSKFDPFRLSAPVRRTVGQGRSTVSFEDVIDENRIVLVNLSKGLLGEYNSNLIGFVILTRLWAATLGRATVTRGSRHPFFVYVDEFQNLTSETLPNMLSEARKFGVGITLANQFFEQVNSGIRAAIMGNVGTRIAFRLGPPDAALFSSWMGPTITPEHLIHMSNYHAFASLSNKGEPLDPVNLATEPVVSKRSSRKAKQIRRRSRERWATPVEEIDSSISQRWADVEGSFGYQLSERDTEEEQARPKRSSAFLDEWLEKRRQRLADETEDDATDDHEGDDPLSTAMPDE